MDWCAVIVDFLGGQFSDMCEKLSDEQLVLLARTDEKELSRLIARYIGVVHSIAVGLSAQASEDLVQEGLLGLLSAVKNYNADKNAKFSTYASLCIRHKMLKSIRNNVTVEFSELEEQISCEDEVIPEEIVIQQERMDEIYKKINSALSELEWQVFQMFLIGLSYNQIAARLNISVKSAGNAMQRVRRKLKSLLR